MTALLFAGLDGWVATLVTALALVLGLGLVVLFVLAVGYSVYRSVRRSRLTAARGRLHDEFVEMVFAPDPDWAGWVTDHSDSETEVVESLLDEYLRELDGQNARRLGALGATLGIPERSKKRLETGGKYDRLYALRWLTLLDEPEPLRQAAFTPTTPRERAAVARLRHETDDFEHPREGIELLLGGASAQFTVFGQDTLYRVATDNPGALFAVAANSYHGWSEPLLIQVLRVCRSLGTSVTTESLSWLIALLEDDRPGVRGAAVGALQSVGWRGDVRDERFVKRLLEDPDPTVRGVTYSVLAEWGDEQALDALAGGLADERAPRARLAGTDALATRRDTLPEAVLPEVASVWEWSRERADHTQRVRQREQTGEQVA